MAYVKQSEIAFIVGILGFKLDGRVSL